LIACEKAGRRARLIELDPKYVDVIVKRWEEYTGQKAQMIQGADEPVEDEALADEPR
jgi:DNA modification methylase